MRVRFAGARRLAAGVLPAIAMVFALAPASASAAEPEAVLMTSDLSDPPSAPYSRVGAGTPGAGKIEAAGSAGMIFILPHVTLGATIGLGGGAAVELRYRNIAGLGQNGKLRFAWSTRISDRLIYGVAARTSITYLGLADAGVIGIQFSNVAIGNDWDVGGDMALTWLRPGQAHVTASIGPTWTLGGIRYKTFDGGAFEIEPGPRSIDLSVQGEWELSSRLSFFLRLDGAVLLDTEIIPLGFVPTGSVGFGWSVQKP